MPESGLLPRLPPHLSPDRDIHVIISILSGRHDAQSYYDTTLKPVLEQRSVHHILHKTTSAKSISALCTSRFIPSAVKGVKQTILLLSGDGGIIDIVNTIATTLMRDNNDIRAASIFVKPVIALFPLGTANALATSAGISTDPISTLLTGKPRPLPIFESTFSPSSKLVTEYGQSREPITNNDDSEPTIYGAVVFSWGLHASLVATSDTPEYRKHGVERFKMAAQELLQDPHMYKGKVKIRRDRYSDFEDLIYPSPTLSEPGNQSPSASASEEHVYILNPLVSSLEPNFLISPLTTTPSNTLYLLAIRPSPTPNQTSSDLMRILTLAYQNGAHISSSEESVVYMPIDGLRIDFNEPDERWRQVCVDGKIIAVSEGGWVEVRMLPAMGMDGRRVVEVVVPR